MAGLCEGGNEPPGSLKATCYGAAVVYTPVSISPNVSYDSGCMCWRVGGLELIRPVVVAGMEAGVVKELQAALFPVCAKGQIWGSGW
ncbi:hypothetical protein ANN_06542 [Periplaneta americana]|uniref:Per a allergen n=1 Tax=Periplaneta americana TaxID=6978 RepID=A0ABQ8TDZ4_PERAM|nr:hypothetical protein ANN_06542 [Periplaneta americana]